MYAHMPPLSLYIYIYIYKRVKSYAIKQGRERERAGKKVFKSIIQYSRSFQFLQREFSFSLPKHKDALILSSFDSSASNFYYSTFFYAGLFCD
jgi:hypothetical protein